MPTRALDAFLKELRATDAALAKGLSDGLTTGQRSRLRERITRAPGVARELTLEAFAQAFIRPRVSAQAKGRPEPLELPELDRRMQGVFALAFPNDGSDLELALARSALSLLRLEREYASPEGPGPTERERWTQLSAALKTVPTVYAAMLAGSELDGLRGLLQLIERWIWARANYTQSLSTWSSLAPSAAADDAAGALLDIWLERQ